MNYDLIWELAGYFAALLFIPALIIQLRPFYKWFSLAGSIIFIFYGFAINAYPVCLLNTFIFIVSFVYLYKSYSKINDFKVLKINANSLYLKEFLKFYKNDIFYYFPNFEYRPKNYIHQLLILRNTSVACVFFASRYDNNTLYLELDYVIPEFRDNRIGKFIYQKHVDVFIKQGYTRIISPCFNRKHEKYLRKMGFELRTIDDKRQFVKMI